MKALETEFAFTAEESDWDAPNGTELNPDLAIGLAWNNYDVNMDTLDGKDILHATVGIFYETRVRQIAFISLVETIDSLK